MRVEWGCDSPTDSYVYQTTCSLCGGLGCDDPKPCDVEDCDDMTCENGLAHWHRCPSAIMDELMPRYPGLPSFFGAYRAFDAHGTLPVAGGWINQSALFGEACSVVNAERGRIERLEEKIREQQAKRRSGANKGAG